MLRAVFRPLVPRSRAWHVPRCSWAGTCEWCGHGHGRAEVVAVPRTQKAPSSSLLPEMQTLGLLSSVAGSESSPCVCKSPACPGVSMNVDLQLGEHFNCETNPVHPKLLALYNAAKKKPQFSSAVLQRVLSVPGEILVHDRELAARTVNPDVPSVCQPGKGVYLFIYYYFPRKKLRKGQSLVCAARCCRLPGCWQIRAPGKPPPAAARVVPGEALLALLRAC